MQQPTKQPAVRALAHLKNQAIDPTKLSRIKGGNCDDLPPAVQEVVGDHDVIGG